MVYHQEWFNKFDKVDQAAQIVGKIVYDVIHPNSVIDIGCGIGAWLSTFKELGASTILGVDGSYIDKDWLRIPAENFRPHDLQHKLELEDRFDLAVCLEVGEHLPEKSSSTLVQTLVNTAPVVMFSAAVPFQGGTAHVNEQWQSFWADLFAEHNYVAVDYIRSKVWGNDDVYYFYRQNIILYIHKDKLADYPTLQKTANELQDTFQLNLVHPMMLEKIHWRRSLNLTKQAVDNTLKKRRPRK